MKKILLSLLSVCLCTLSLSGCITTSIMELPIETIRQPSGQNQASEFPLAPSVLTVSVGNESISAWMGTYSWTTANKDGTESTTHADSMHPLACLDTMNGFKLSGKSSVKLIFDEKPTSITVKRYKADETNYDSFVEISVIGNSFEMEEGEYLYEIIVTWDQWMKSYSGTVHYAFHTTK